MNIRDRARRLISRIFGTGPNKPRPLAEDTQARIRARVDAAQADFNNRVTALAQGLTGGTETLRTWRAKMITEIRYLLLTSAAAGAGGGGRLKPDDIARVDAAVRTQVGYLNRWVAQMERAPALPSAAFIANRAKMYGGSGTAVAEEAADKRAFQEFPDLPFYPAHRTLCRNNCKCHWEWRVLDRENGDADVFWRLGNAEHCETCVVRARACAPLRCRAFQWVNLPTDPSAFA